MVTLEHGLTDRQREILFSVIKIHIATGEPVGSLLLAERLRERLSSATIRNIMAELEEAGYLTHPHTSAGRIPTDKGYRYYVDNMLKPSRPSKSDQDVIRRELLSEEMLGVDQLMERTSHLLSQLSENVGIVIPPLQAYDPIQHISFVKLADRRILVVTVSKTGLVQDRAIRVDEDFTQDELDKTSRYLVENFSGLSLIEIRRQILQLMSEEKALYDRLLQNAIVICSSGLAEESQTAEVYLDGTSNIINKPDFADTERIRTLFRLFEEKSRLVKILNEYIAQSPKGSICVRIGSENMALGMQDCAIIASPYYYRDSVYGSIGVVGPTRIEYLRLINVVNYVARLFERLMDSHN